jgi:ketosteroid isomerase-like protein
MPAENVELARAAMEALSTRDLERLVALSDPEVEWHSFFASLSEGGTYRGHDGLRRYLRDLNDAFEVVQANVDDQVAVGDVVVLVGHIHYIGKDSGLDLRTPAGWVIKCRRGKVILFRAFREPEQSLEGVGLSN